MLSKGGRRLPALAFYGGVFLISACVLTLQLLETRILSVTSWYYLAFFIISMAMFGLTAGAVRVQRSGPAEFEAPAVARAASRFGLSVVAALALQMVLAPVLTDTLTSLAALAALALVLAVPHYFAGIVLCLVLTRSPYPVGRVYAADLCGAGAGCLAALGLLECTDAPTGVLTVGAAGSAAALAFAAGAPLRGAAIKRAALTLVALSGLALVNGVSDGRLRPLVVKERVERRADHERVLWNSLSRVAVGAPRYAAPFLWGESLPDPLELRVEQRYLNIDGDAGTPLYRFDGDLRRAAFLAYDVTQVGHALPGRQRVAIVGVGGGRDVLAAALFGKERIVGIEVNPIFIELLTRDPQIAPFAGIRALDGVELVVDEGRSWLAATEERFDMIQMSLTDTWAATGAGAFTLSENGLYTLEAWRMALERLRPGGVLAVSRWYHRDHVYETGRLISLALATLFDAGATEPRRHLCVVTNSSRTRANNVATLLLARDPLSARDLADLEQFVALRGHSLMLSPTVAPPGPPLGQLVAVRDRAELDRLTRSLDLEFRPPTDDWPFFFNHIRLDRPREILSRLHLFRDYVPTTIIGGVILGNIAALLALLSILFVSSVLVVGLVLRSVRSVAVGLPGSLALGSTAYFVLIGLGFMLVELALLQRSAVFLGHPAYALSVVLFTLITSTGLGSLVSERWPLDRPWRGFAWCGLTGAALIGLAAALPELLARFQHVGLAARASIVAAALTPVGLLLGFGFPTGLRLVAAVDARPTPWLWGVNGAAGVLGSGLAMISSMTLGLRATLVAGALCYWLLAPALLVLFRDGRNVRRQD